MRFAAAAMLAIACAGCISDEKREDFKAWCTKQDDEVYLARQSKGKPAQAYSYTPGDVTKAAVAVAPYVPRVAAGCMKAFSRYPTGPP